MFKKTRARSILELKPGLEVEADWPGSATGYMDTDTGASILRLPPGSG